MSRTAILLGRMRSIGIEVNVFRMNGGKIGASARRCEVKRGPVLESATGSSELSSDDAIEDLWERISKLKDGEYVVMDAYSARRCHRWDGFSWTLVEEAK